MQNMSLSDTVLKTYRRTLKRVPGVHRLAYVAGEAIVVPILEKITAFRTPTGDPLNFRLQLLLGQYERETVDFFKKVIKPGTVVLDIGAHVGYYSRLSATIVGPHGLVIAVEPHPETFQLLTRNLRGYRNVKCLQLAAGESETRMELIDAIVESGGAALTFHAEKREFLLDATSKELSQRSKQKIPIRKFTVIVRPLDAVLEELGVNRVHVLKMDIEGAECLALKGMLRTLEAVEIAVCELAPSNLGSFGFSHNDLLGILKQAGLQTFALLSSDGPKMLTAEQLNEFSNALDIDERVNIVAARGQI